MTEISTNDMSPIIWLKHETPQPLVEWSKEELEHLALLAQADLVFLIAQLFAPPSAELQRLLEIEIPDIEKLLDKSMLPASFAERYQQIRQQAQSLNLETWAAEYKHLFEGNVAACPINESGLIQRDKSVILAEIAEFYQAFGFEREKADHLTSELEFVAMLLVKLAQIKEAKRTTHEALSSFSFNHLGKWLPTFCDRLIETSTLPIYQELAQLLLSAWSEIQTLNQLPPKGKINNKARPNIGLHK